MSDTTIEWTDKTWNPVRGCQVVSAGCKNCYAMKLAHRFSRAGQPYEGLTQLTKNGPVWTGRAVVVPEKLAEPLGWRKPARVFVNSMSDLFHEDVPDEFIAKVFAIMGITARHTFQVLTKRPERMAALLADQDWKDEMGRFGCYFAAMNHVELERAWWPLANVWLGTSVENQQAADERIPWLLRTPAAVRFLSCEPLLGPIDFATRPCPHGCAGRTEDGKPWYCGVNGCEFERPWREDTTSITSCVDWVIVGGESGHGARPMHPDWARTIRDACVGAGVAFFFKQWGEHAPFVGRPLNEFRPQQATGVWPDGRPLLRHEPLVRGAQSAAIMVRVGKKRAGRLLDGREWNEYPAVEVRA